MMLCEGALFILPPQESVMFLLGTGIGFAKKLYIYQN